MATPIGTLGTIPTLTVAGRVFTDLTTIKVLSTRANNQRGTFRAHGSSSGYQVTGGTTLTLWAAKVIAVNTAGEVHFAYSDNDVGINSGTAFTNPVYISGATTVLYYTTSTEKYEIPMKFGVAASKYPGLQTNTADAGVTVFGYET